MDTDPFAAEDDRISIDDHEQVSDEDEASEDEQIRSASLEDLNDRHANDDLASRSDISPTGDDVCEGTPSVVFKQEKMDDDEMGPPAPKLRAVCATAVNEGTYKASPEVLKSVSELLGDGKMFSPALYQSRKDDCQAPAHGALQVPKLDDLVLALEAHLVKKTGRKHGSKLINRVIENMCKDLTQFAFDALNPVNQTVHHFHAGNLTIDTAVDGCLRSAEFIAQLIHFARITRRRNALHGLGLKTASNSTMAGTMLSLPEENDEDSFLFGSTMLTTLFEDSTDKLAAFSKGEKMTNLQNFSKKGRKRTFPASSSSSSSSRFSGFTNPNPPSTSGFDSYGQGPCGYRGESSFASRGGRAAYRGESRGGRVDRRGRGAGNARGWILSTAKGYQLEFDSLPPSYASRPTERSFNVSDSEAISSEVRDMLEKGAIELVVDPPEDSFYSPIFIVPKKDGGVRPVINLRHLNSFLVYEHFKMEGIHCLSDLMTPNCYFTKIDLQDAYFSIPIAADYHKYLSFQWKGKLYRFKCLPFGLASAPRVFTKMLRPLMSELRSKGIKLIVFLDDKLIISDTPEAARQDFDCVAQCLEALGFLINTKKSVSEPSTKIEFLGFVIDSETMTLSLSETKMKNLKQLCTSILSRNFISLRDLAKLLGHFNSVTKAILPASLYCRNLQFIQREALQSNTDWDELIQLSDEARQDIKLWCSCINIWNGRTVSVPSPDLIISSDASMQGWGTISSVGKVQGIWCWSNEDRFQHINYLELKAAFLAIKSFAPNVNFRHVRLKLDNTSAIAYINRQGGTHSQPLCKLAIHLWEWCLSRNMFVSAEHIPGVSNSAADFLSRNLTDASDWALSRPVFEKINNVLGPLVLDLFASHRNAQLPNFYSWGPDPFADRVNAFSQVWTQDAAYAFPPFALVGKCLSKVVADRAHLVLVAPIWPNQPWYPLMLSLLVHKPLLLPQSRDLLVDPLGNFHPLLLNGTMQLAAWQVSANSSLQEGFRRTLPLCLSRHGLEVPQSNTTELLRGGIVGAIGNNWIPFIRL